VLHSVAQCCTVLQAAAEHRRPLLAGPATQPAATGSSRLTQPLVLCSVAQCCIVLCSVVHCTVVCSVAQPAATGFFRLTQPAQSDSEMHIMHCKVQFKCSTENNYAPFTVQGYL
jgi:hypothetical protein